MWLDRGMHRKSFPVTSDLRQRLLSGHTSVECPRIEVLVPSYEVNFYFDSIEQDWTSQVFQDCGAGHRARRPALHFQALCGDGREICAVGNGGDGDSP